MNNQEEMKEKYIGSVRFYKHLILSVIGMMILVPACLSIVLAVWNVRLNTKYMETSAKLLEVEAELNAELAVNEQKISVAETREDSSTMVSSSKKIFVSKTISKDDWNMILVNEKNPIPQGYEVQLERLTTGQKVDARIVTPLNEMFQAMRAEGMQPMVCSGYRTIEKQHNLFEEDIKQQVRLGSTYDQAFYKAKEQTALPGASEHHTGLAVDIVGKTHQSLNAAQAKTQEAIWLAEHCAEYGFILRYPADKTDITGIAYESWHFRYVGQEAAAYIMENGIAFEEFVEMLN